MSQRSFFQAAMITIVALLVSGNAYRIRAQACTEVQIGQYGSNIVSLATFTNLDDGYRVVIVALANGEIREIYFRPGNATKRGESVLKVVPGVTAIAGFYDQDTTYRTLLIGDRYGNLYKYAYNPRKAAHFVQLANYAGKQIVALSSYYYGKANITANSTVALSDNTVGAFRHFKWDIDDRNGFRYSLGTAPGKVLAIADYWSVSDDLFAKTSGRTMVSLSDGRIVWRNGSTWVLFTAYVDPVTSFTSLGTNLFAANRAGQVGFIYDFDGLDRAFSPLLGSVPPVTKVAMGEKHWVRAWARGTRLYTQGCY